MQLQVKTVKLKQQQIHVPTHNDTYRHTTAQIQHYHWAVTWVCDSLKQIYMYGYTLFCMLLLIYTQSAIAAPLRIRELWFKKFWDFYGFKGWFEHSTT